MRRPIPDPPIPHPRLHPDIASYPEVSAAADRLKVQATTLSTTLGNLAKAHASVTTLVCYLFAMGSDPAHPDQWPAAKVSGKSKYTASGLTTGQKVYFRIAIIRRGDVQGQWSDVLEVTVK